MDVSPLRRYPWRILLTLMAAEGALAFLFSLPADIAGTRQTGFSRTHLLLGFLLAGATILLTALAWRAWRDRQWLADFAGRIDALLCASLLTYLVMNLQGQTSGEVQRLWLFLLPLVALFAGSEAGRLFAGKRTQPSAVLLVVLLQLITVFLTFRYQDFYS